MPNCWVRLRNYCYSAESNSNLIAERDKALAERDQALAELAESAALTDNVAELQKDFDELKGMKSLLILAHVLKCLFSRAT